MRSSRSALTALFVVVFILSLLATIPAGFLSAAILSASHGKLELANCNGTIWHGSAVPVLHRSIAKAGSVPLGTLQWTISISSLLTMHPRITLNWPDESLPLPTEARISLHQLTLNNLYLPLPASLLGELSPYLRPIELGGRIVVKSDALNITDQGVSGTLVADWTGANSALSNLSPLGDYRFVIKAAGTRGDLSLETTSGVLILNGNGNIDARGTVNFNGTAQAADGLQEKLSELLRQLGPETAPGQHAFSLASN